MSYSPNSLKGGYIGNSPPFPLYSPLPDIPREISASPKFEALTVRGAHFRSKPCLKGAFGGPEAPGAPWNRLEAPGGPWRLLEAPGGPLDGLEAPEKPHMHGVTSTDPNIYYGYIQ